MRICSDGFQLESCLANTNWVNGTDKPIKIEVFGEHLLPSTMIFTAKQGSTVILTKDTNLDITYAPESTTLHLIAEFTLKRSEYPASGNNLTYQIKLHQLTNDQIFELDSGTLNLIRR